MSIELTKFGEPPNNLIGGPSCPCECYCGGSCTCWGSDCTCEGCTNITVGAQNAIPVLAPNAVPNRDGLDVFDSGCEDYPW